MSKKIEEIKIRLSELKTEHRDLDEVINNLETEPYFDQLRLQRLKKRKLFLKDQINRMEGNILPNIIA